MFSGSPCFEKGTGMNKHQINEDGISKRFIGNEWNSIHCRLKAILSAERMRRDFLLFSL